MEKNTKLIPYDTDYEICEKSSITAQPFTGSVPQKDIDKALSIIADAIAITETEVAIEKKEVDTAAYATKSHIELEKAVVSFLINDCKREGITPEELKENKERIEAAELRIKEESENARNSLEKSAYRTAGKWKLPVSIVAIFVAGCFCEKYFRPHAA